jgi:hypothetical protein
MSSEAELNKLKVADLTELLKEKGLPTKGNKADLVAVPNPALLPQAPPLLPALGQLDCWQRSAHLRRGSAMFVRDGVYRGGLDEWVRAGESGM